MIMIVVEVSIILLYVAFPVQGLSLKDGQLTVAADASATFDALNINIGFTGGATISRDAIFVATYADGSTSAPYKAACTRDQLQTVSLPSTFRNIASLGVTTPASTGAVFAINQLEVS